MKRHLFPLVSAAALALSTAALVDAQESAPETAAPQVFLDKNPRIVAYQLKRLSNPQLLAIERKDTEPKYKLVYQAILTRKAMDRKYRQEAVDALAKLNQSDAAVEILAGVANVDADDKATVRELVAMLMAQKPASLAAQREKIQSLAVESANNAVKPVAYAALAAADGKADAAWDLAAQNKGLRYLLAGLPLINDPKVRETFYSRVEPLVQKASDRQTHAAAIEAMGSIPGHEADVFKLLAGIVRDGKGNDRLAAVRAIRRIPDDKWPENQVETLASAVVKLIEQTPPGERTQPAVLQAIQLGDDLTGMLSEEKGAPLRKTLRDLGVRVVAIRTLREQMAYDTRYFAVQAGKPVQIVLENEDAMPHNLVITAPGALQEVAVAGGVLPPPADPKEPAYVPHSPKVLQALNLVQADESATLSFTAPREPGEYPFVCTFPGHWVRMYGIMLVVPDYDAWEKSPKSPQDPMTHKPMESPKNDPTQLQAHQH